MKLREQIRVADRSHGYGADLSSKTEDSCHAINKQYEETSKVGSHYLIRFSKLN